MPKTSARQPAAKFSLSSLGKDTFQKVDYYFQNTFFFYYVNSFRSKIKKFFLPENLTIRVEKFLSLIDIIWYAFYNKFSAFGVYEKVQFSFE